MFEPFYIAKIVSTEGLKLRRVTKQSIYPPLVFHVLDTVVKCLSPYLKKDDYLFVFSRV